ncbi:hypothetical protein [Paenibacillus macquariensis]|uniref:Replicase n=1 Tax=Paenibacillus macquariensis TaxID=948756 RepID=A0ABY1JS89_9BACL|nr:hypothetical protein [Paenibacillus macquariensis]MEC0092873.1 hypothetical protein [Paenibacillus macquariensis]OAB36249.1 hypothetical protein PMSM_07310 [Paenibacillus macquariensis subsp. macquariensis]SIQ67920.1 hypothetical protein SAMN05421578_103327 [Paenibacillus macquariensis]
MNINDRYPKLFLGNRRSGKTTQLIKRAAETGYPILAANDAMGSFILLEARQTGYENIRIVSVNQLLNNRRDIGKVIIDESQSILEQLLHVSIDSMSVTTYDATELKSLKDGGFGDG